jgi:glycerol-3-phosphate dehydrogenase
MQKLCTIMLWPAAGRSRSDILPGGDFGASGVTGYKKALKERFPWLPEMQADRYVRQYGTRADALLEGVQKIGDLGRHLGADLYQREVDFLIESEWAASVEDIIWRRSKLGLRLSPVEIGRLASYLKNLDPSSKRALS